MAIINKAENRDKQQTLDRTLLLKESKERLVDIIFALIERVNQLEDKVAKLSRNSSTSSKPPSSDITKPPRPKDGVKRRHGAQEGHSGTTRSPFNEDDVDEIKELASECCEHCQSKSIIYCTEIDAHKHQQAELIEKPIKITEYIQPAYLCISCGQIHYAPLPDGVLANQLFGVRLQSLIGYMKGTLHCSYSTIQEFFKDVLVLDVSCGLLCDTIRRLNETLRVPYEQLKEQIKKEACVHIDESGWKNNGATRWAWVFATKLISFFTIESSRGSGVLKEILGATFKGCLISDFFSAYVKYANKIQQFCLAHLIRDIKFLTTLKDVKEQRFGKVLLRQFKLMFYLWHRRDSISRKKYMAYMHRIKDKIRSLLDADDIPLYASKLAKRFHKHWDAIFLFVFHNEIEPTNNVAERAIRALVLDRKVTQGSRSEMGIQWNARIWTVLSTCKKQQRSAWRFIESCVNAYYFNAPYPSLIPSK